MRGIDLSSTFLAKTGTSVNCELAMVRSKSTLDEQKYNSASTAGVCIEAAEKSTH